MASALGGGRNDPHPVDYEDFDNLKELRKLAIKDLLLRIKEGVATHQELAVAARMLRDNGITLIPPKSDEEEREEAKRMPVELPDFEEDGGD